MIFCTQCGTSIREAHRYCWNCGAKAETASIVTVRAVSRSPEVAMPGGFSARAQAATAVHAAGPASSRRFGQIFGLDPRVAFLTLIVDLMLNAGDVATMGLLLPVSIAAGVVLGYVAYRAQINWYGDDKESARIKAIVLGLLTAIPTPLPELLYIPAGLVGLLHGFWRREPRT